MARAARFSSRVDAVILGACILLSLVVLVLPLSAREPVAQVLRRSIVAPLVGLQRGAEQWRAAWLSRGREALVRDTLAMRAFAVPALETENSQLRRLLGLSARLRWGFVPAEAVHQTSGAEQFMLTLTAGSRAGVKKGAPVVAPEGVVGMIESVDPTIALAITFNHVDFRVSAMTADGNAFGIVAAHLGGNAADRYLLEMRGVPFRTQVKPGTWVYSSGLGGVYPRGIPVGVVLREIGTAEGWARTYLLRPAVNPADVSAVMVLDPQRARDSLGGVWEFTTRLDSAVQGVVAGGDSVVAADSAAARAALAAARKALLDSIARTTVDSLRRDSTGAIVPGGVPGAPAVAVPAPAPAPAPVRRPAATQPRPQPQANPPATVPVGPPAPAPAPPDTSRRPR